MTPEEKAKELYNKYAVFWHDTTDACKQQCLICCDEIMMLDVWDDPNDKIHYGLIFWQSVKQEIKKL